MLLLLRLARWAVGIALIAYLAITADRAIALRGKTLDAAGLTLRLVASDIYDALAVTPSSPSRCSLKRPA